MPTIGTITVDVMSGYIAPPTEQSDMYRRPGVDGVGVQLTGTAPTPSMLQTFEGLAQGTAAASLATKLEAYAALKNTIVSITDDRGRVRTKCLINDVQAQPQAASLVAGFTADPVDTVIRATWQVMDLE